MVASGGSQCGFCTPGIVMRLAALDGPVTDERVDQSLLAHLCRCTGWQTIREAAHAVLDGRLGRCRTRRPRPRCDAAAERAALEGGVPQRVGRGRGARAMPGSPTTAVPDDALVAVADDAGGYVVAAVPAGGAGAGRQGPGTQHHRPAVPSGRCAAGGVGADARPPPGWSRPTSSPTPRGALPGGVPASPYGNGGAFGGKLHSPVAGDARRLADEHGRPVRVLWSREDVVRRGPKRPPVAAGMAADGTGVLRVGRHRRPGRPGRRLGSTRPFGRRGGARSGRRAGGGRRPARLVRPAGRGVGRGRRAGRGGASRRPEAPRWPTRPSRSSRPGVGGPWCAAVPTGRSRSRWRPAPCSIPWCSAPTPSARATRPSVGWAPRGSPSSPDGADPGPDDPVVRHPPGAGHATGDGAAGGARPRVRRSTDRTRCSPRWPPPAGWPTVCRRRGRPTGPARAVAEEHRSDIHGGCPRNVIPDGNPSTRLPADPSEEPSMSTPVGPYTPIVRSGSWLVCSGQLGLVAGTDGGAPALVEGGPGAAADPGGGQRRLLVGARGRVAGRRGQDHGVRHRPGRLPGGQRGLCGRLR